MPPCHAKRFMPYALIQMFFGASAVSKSDVLAMCNNVCLGDQNFSQRANRLSQLTSGPYFQPQRSRATNCLM